MVPQFNANFSSLAQLSSLALPDLSGFRLQPSLPWPALANIGSISGQTPPTPAWPNFTSAGGQDPLQNHVPRDASEGHNTGQSQEAPPSQEHRHQGNIPPFMPPDYSQYLSMLGYNPSLLGSLGQPAPPNPALMQSSGGQHPPAANAQHDEPKNDIQGILSNNFKWPNQPSANTTPSSGTTDGFDQQHSAAHGDGTAD